LDDGAGRADDPAEALWLRQCGDRPIGRITGADAVDHRQMGAHGVQVETGGECPQARLIDLEAAGQKA
jgi:hypothetical protein